MIPLLDRQMRFIIRLKGDRSVIYQGHPVIASELSCSTKMLYAERIVREESGGEKPQTIQFGFRRVRFPGRKEQLSLVVVRGFGAQPLMLLTNLEVKPTRKSLFFVVEAYIRRWQIEETIRFEKQTYGIEDIRLSPASAGQNMIALTLAVAYFVTMWLGEGLRLPILTHHALAASKRLFSVPDFRYYALSRMASNGPLKAARPLSGRIRSNPGPIPKSCSRYRQILGKLLVSLFLTRCGWYGICLHPRDAPRGGRRLGGKLLVGATLSCTG